MPHPMPQTSKKHITSLAFSDLIFLIHTCYLAHHLGMKINIHTFILAVCIVIARTSTGFWHFYIDFTFCLVLVTGIYRTLYMLGHVLPLNHTPSLRWFCFEGTVAKELSGEHRVTMLHEAGNDGIFTFCRQKPRSAPSVHLSVGCNILAYRVACLYSALPFLSYDKWGEGTGDPCWCEVICMASYGLHGLSPLFYIGMRDWSCCAACKAFGIMLLAQLMRGGCSLIKAVSFFSLP